MPDDVFEQSYNMLLEAAGYFTGQLGKYGVGNEPEQKNDSAFGMRRREYPKCSRSSRSLCRPAACFASFKLRMLRSRLVFRNLGEGLLCKGGAVEFHASRIYLFVVLVKSGRFLWFRFGNGYSTCYVARDTPTAWVPTLEAVPTEIA